MLAELPSLGEAASVFAAGAAAGFINVLVGSGTLISFPVLLLFGYPPLTANISSSLGLVFGSLSGAWGYRREIAQNIRIAKMLMPASMLGGLVGGGLLLVLPSSVFDVIVPVLVALGLVMVVVGPLIQKRAATRQGAASLADTDAYPASRGKVIATWIIAFLLGIYGGYFGAAQGILLVGFFGLILTTSLQNINALKNFLVAGLSIVVALLFAFFATEHIDWSVVVILAAGALLGGTLGARLGRRIPPNLLRGIILVVGTVALINLLR